MSSLWLLAAEGPNGRFIPSDPKELYFGGAAFLIVLAFMVWKLGPVISSALSANGDKVRAELESADQAQAAADAEVAELAARLGNADADGARLVQEAKAAADKLKADSAARAAADAEAIRARAVADAEGMRAQATADLQVDLNRRTMMAAEDVVRSSLDDAAHADLIEQYIDQVGAQA